MAKREKMAFSLHLLNSFFIFLQNIFELPTSPKGEKSPHFLGNQIKPNPPLIPFESYSLILPQMLLVPQTFEAEPQLLRTLNEQQREIFRKI